MRLTVRQDKNGPYVSTKGSAWRPRTNASPTFMRIGDRSRVELMDGRFIWLRILGTGMAEKWERTDDVSTLRRLTARLRK